MFEFFKNCKFPPKLLFLGELTLDFKEKVAPSGILKGSFVSGFGYGGMPIEGIENVVLVSWSESGLVDLVVGFPGVMVDYI